MGLVKEWSSGWRLPGPCKLRTRGGSLAVGIAASTCPQLQGKGKLRLTCFACASLIVFLHRFLQLPGPQCWGGDQPGGTGGFQSPCPAHALDVGKSQDQASALGSRGAPGQTPVHRVQRGPGVGGVSGGMV